MITAVPGAWDLLCFSHLRWNFVFQRPQHLMSRCAKERRVFFVEEPIVDAPTPRLAVEAHDGVQVVVPHLPECDEPQAAAMRKMLAAKINAEADDQTLQIMSATDAGRAQVKAWTATADARVAAQLIYDDMTTDLRPELGAISAPLTMLYPLDASAMPADMVDGLYKGAFATAKTATLKRIDGSRHFIMLDQPAAFAAAVDTFLAN